jgi:hypothetical protein
VIDGEFTAHHGPDNKPWLLLRAVDGTGWDIVSRDPAVLNRYERAFPYSTPLPS